MNQQIVSDKLDLINNLVSRITDLNKIDIEFAVTTQISDIRKQLMLYGVVSSKNEAEIKQTQKALKAITAWRQLDGLNLLSDSEKYEIKERLMAVYGKYLSLIRTEQ